MAFNIFERWPWTSFQNLNLDWLMKAMKSADEHAAAAEQAADEANELANTYAGQIEQANNTAEAAQQAAAQATAVYTDSLQTAREIDGFFEPVVLVGDWEQGNIDAETGENYVSLQVIRTNMYPFSGVVQPNSIQLGAGETVDRVSFVYCYDGNKQYLGRVGTAGNSQKSLLENTAFIRLTYGFRAESGLTVEQYGINNLIADFDMEFIPAAMFKPFTQHSAAGAIADVGDTYLQVAYADNDNILYGSQHGPFSAPFLTGNQKATSCSQFLKALLMGVTYPMSGYVNGTEDSPVNYPLPWGYEYDASTSASFPAGSTVLSAAQLAKYCEDKGWLVPFSTTHNNIKAGDIVFFTDGSTGTYLGITHCAYVLTVTDVGCYLLHAGRDVDRPGGGLAGIEVQAATWGTDLAANFVMTHTAHIPIKAAPHTVQMLMDDRTEYIGTAASSGSTTFTHRYSIELERGIYTMVWTDEGPNRSYFQIALENGTNLTMRAYKYGDQYRAVFFIPAPCVGFNFRMAGGRDQIGHIKRVRLYKGYYDNKL